MKLKRYNNSFEYGEITPRMMSRTDLPSYNKGLKKQRNMYSLMHGGSMKRRGLEHVGRVRYQQSEAFKIIPFTHTDQERYLLIFSGDANIPTIAEILDVETGQYVSNPDGSRYGLQLPFYPSQYADLRYTQAGATMIFSHPAMMPHQIQRITRTNWFQGPVQFDCNAVSDAPFSNAWITFRIANGTDYFREGEKFIIETNADGSIVDPLRSVLGPGNVLTYPGLTDPNNKNSRVKPGNPNALTKMDLNAKNYNRKDITVATAGTNIPALSDQLLLNGRQLGEGDRVLVKDQTDPKLNGVWIVGAKAAAAGEDPGEFGTETFITRVASSNLNVQSSFGGGETTPTTGYQISRIAVVGNDGEENLVPYAGGGGPESGDYNLPGNTNPAQEFNILFDETRQGGEPLWGQTVRIYFRNRTGSTSTSTVAWVRSPDFQTPADFQDAIVRVVGFSDGTGVFYRQIGNVQSDYSGQIWERFDGVGNGRIVGIQSMPESSGARTWTIECVLSSPSRQEWKVTASDFVNLYAYRNLDGSTGLAPYPSTWKQGDFPAALCFHEQRLFFGGSRLYPQHIWGSGAGDVFNMTLGTLDQDAVVVQMAGEYTRILHLIPARQMIVMTSTSENSLAGPNGGAISGINSNIIKTHTRNGCNNIRPINIDAEIIFSQRDGKKLRAIQYALEVEGFQSPDVSVLAEHFTRASADGANYAYKDMAFAASPDWNAWIIRTDGKLLSMMLARDLDITAWAQHETSGRFEAVTTVPGVYHDEVYFIVSRLVFNPGGPSAGASIVYSLEKFDYTEWDTLYLDAATHKVYTELLSVHTGLEHLEGLTVRVVADGKIHPDRVVLNGQITTDYPCYRLMVGLVFSTELVLTPQEFGDPVRTTQSSTQTVVGTTVNFLETQAATINGEEVPFRNFAENVGDVIKPYSGHYKLPSLGWNEEPQEISITSTSPTPLHVLGVIMDVEVTIDR